MPAEKQQLCWPVQSPLSSRNIQQAGRADSVPNGEDAPDDRTDGDQEVGDRHVLMGFRLAKSLQVLNIE